MKSPLGVLHDFKNVKIWEKKNLLYCLFSWYSLQCVLYKVLMYTDSMDPTPRKNTSGK